MARSPAHIAFVTLIIELPLTDRFSSLIKGLLSDVIAEAPGGWVAAPLFKLLWWRLRRMTARFASIMAQYDAGRLAAGPLPAAGSTRGRRAPAGPADASSAVARPRPADGPRPMDLPRRVGWVVQVIPGASVWGDQLKEMLADPELPAAVAGAPQLGSVLRPMCRMMAVKPPAWLRLPRRPRPPREAPRPVVVHPPAPDWLVNEPGTVLRADGSVWMHLGSSTHWKPGCGLTLEQARKFDPPVRIWPRPE